MTKLVDLDPCWVADFDPEARSHRRGGDLTIATAQGVIFECPKCGRHSILAWFRGRGVPADALPGPGRWTPSGSGFHDLTLTPSINLDTPNAPSDSCRWHGWVTGGEAT